MIELIAIRILNINRHMNRLGLKVTDILPNIPENVIEKMTLLQWLDAVEGFLSEEELRQFPPPL